MNQAIRSRLFLLLGLTVIGIGVAGAGTTLGMTEPLTKTGSHAEFTISEGNVTFSAGGESRTIVDNMSNVSEISIRENDTGQFSIQTAEERPLSDSERKRARAIALNNTTVALALDEMSRYDVTVEPVQQLTLSEDNHDSYNINIQTNQTDHSTSGTFTINNSTAESQQDGSVTIHRDPTYVEDRAVVRVRQPGTDGPRELLYVIDVDLSNGTVSDIVDFRSL